MRGAFGTLTRDFVERSEGSGACDVDFGLAGGEEVLAGGGEGGLKIGLVAPAAQGARGDVETHGDVLGPVSAEEMEEGGALGWLESVVGLLV